MHGVVFVFSQFLAIKIKVFNKTFLLIFLLIYPSDILENLKGILP